MAVSVVHFGIDNCNRVPVLKSAGYIVDSCRLIPELKERFKKFPRPAAIVIDGLKKRSLVPALTVIRAWPEPPPIVLFDESYSSGNEQLHVDLVIPPVTPPEEWLRELAELLERSRAVLRTSAAVREESALLRMDSEALRRSSALTRQESVRQQENYRVQKQAAAWKKPAAK